MKVIQHPFKEFCDSLFSESSESTLVYEFYKFLKPGYDESTKLMTSTERKKKSLSYLVSEFGKDTILDAIKELNRQYKAGELKSNTIVYFNRFVAKFASNRGYNSTQYTPLSSQKVEAIVVTGKKLRKQTDEFSGDFEQLNWIYQCSNCSGEFDGWADTCPSCKRPIDWSAIVI